MSEPPATKPAPSAAPEVSVVIRSLNRVAALCELLASVLAQQGPTFEVIVVEQSTKVSPADAARLTAFASDPRVRLLRHRPLGGAQARNVGVGAARGAIVVFIDDDDLPVGDTWLSAHLANYDDPGCLGVTGRHQFEDGETDPYGRRRQLAYKRCMRFSPLLKLPWAYVRQSRPKRPVDQVHGTNGSIRRSAFDRFGGWDPDTRVEDEASFGYKARLHKSADEYFCFDPIPVVCRRLNLPGGLDKRFMTHGEYFRRLMTFVHRIVGRYHRTRVVVLWPLYVYAAYGWSVDWIWNDAFRYRSFGSRLLATLTLLPLAPVYAIASLIYPSIEAPTGSGTGSLSRSIDPSPQNTST